MDTLVLLKKKLITFFTLLSDTTVLIAALIFLSLFILTVLYALKSLLGIDIFPGGHFWDVL